LKFCALSKDANTYQSLSSSSTVLYTTPITPWAQPVGQLVRGPQNISFP